MRVAAASALWLWLVLASTCASASASGGEELRLNAYTSEGELAQVAFAARGVDKCSPAVGFVVGDELGVLLSCSPRPSPLSLRVSSTIEWMDGVGVCAVGYKADCLRLKTEWRGVVENHKFIFGEAPAASKIATKLSAVLTSGLYPERGRDKEREAPFARPLAASVLFLASDEAPAGGRLRLLQLDNSGAIFRCHKLAALGSLAAHAKDLAAVSDAVGSASVSASGDEAAALVERVAASLFRHSQRALGFDSDLAGGGGDTETEAELELECLVVDGRGRGQHLRADSPAQLRSALVASLARVFKN